MYLSLTLALGNMFAVVPPVVHIDQTFVEQRTDIVNDRSIKIAQQPPATPTSKELTFQEDMDKRILRANQYHAQKKFTEELTLLNVINAAYFSNGTPRKALPYIESSLKIAVKPQ
jgi:hypothetical protein